MCVYEHTEYVKKESSFSEKCKLYEKMAEKSLGLRKRNIKSIIYMNTNILGDFPICIGVPLDLANQSLANMVGETRFENS